mmetsp:Transcript_9252/g.22919  ORF Transcript_9252/g.22919 Transcript_9252/m.22919 type:complete len:350 (-) Transcript_9252:125-1174(-)
MSVKQCICPSWGMPAPVLNYYYAASTCAPAPPSAYSRLSVYWSRSGPSLLSCAIPSSTCLRCGPGCLVSACSAWNVHWGVRSNRRNSSRSSTPASARTRLLSSLVLRTSSMRRLASSVCARLDASTLMWFCRLSSNLCTTRDLVEALMERSLASAQYCASTCPSAPSTGVALNVPSTVPSARMAVGMSGLAAPGAPCLYDRAATSPPAAWPVPTAASLYARGAPDGAAWPVGGAGRPGWAGAATGAATVRVSSGLPPLALPSPPSGVSMRTVPSACAASSSSSMSPPPWGGFMAASHSGRHAAATDAGTLTSQIFLLSLETSNSSAMLGSRDLIMWTKVLFPRATDVDN